MIGKLFYKDKAFFDDGASHDGNFKQFVYFAIPIAERDKKTRACFFQINLDVYSWQKDKNIIDSFSDCFISFYAKEVDNGFLMKKFEKKDLSDFKSFDELLEKMVKIDKCYIENAKTVVISNSLSEKILKDSLLYVKDSMDMDEDIEFLVNNFNRLSLYGKLNNEVEKIDSKSRFKI